MAEQSNIQVDCGFSRHFVWRGDPIDATMPVRDEKSAVKVRIRRPDKMLISSSTEFQESHLLFDGQEASLWFSPDREHLNCHWKSQQCTSDYVLSRHEALSMVDIDDFTWLFRSDAVDHLKKCSEFHEKAGDSKQFSWSFIDPNGHAWELSANAAAPHDLIIAAVSYRQSIRWIGRATTQSNDPRSLSVVVNGQMDFHHWRSSPVSDDVFAATVPQGARVNDEYDPPTLSLNSIAPDFSIKRIAGQNIRLSELRGHSVVLDFWFTECHACVVTMPYLTQQVALRRAKAVQIYCINPFDNDVSKLSKFVKSNAWDSNQILLDSDQSVAGKYKVRAYPATFVIGSDGRVLYVGTPEDDEGKAAFLRALDSACAKAKEAS